jgi:rhamnogalacturonyl hydrolase YesR
MPAFTPTVVATGIITNGLHVYSEITGNERARAMVLEAVPFVLNDLNRTIEGEEFCFSYSPVDTQVVFNATMKGARLLAQAFKITGNHDLASQARRTVAFVMRHQRDDGAWIYSSGDARTWVDNFHTGYVLDCLASYMECTGDESFKAQYDKGLRFYLGNFIDDEGRPKYYDTRTWPVDCTAAGQMLLTLLEAGCTGPAGRVAQWMIANMQAPGGNFYYQKHRHWTNRIPYMRWSDAWMLVGLSRFLWEFN